MIDGIYNGAAGLSALSKWQETISQNLASSNAPGFKKLEFSVDGVAGKKAISGNTDPGAPGHAMPRTSKSVNFSPGLINHTGNTTDMAIQGEGFFRVQGPENKTLYTRDGEFHVNADGLLVTKQGYQVQGEGGGIQLDPNRGNPVVATDGTVSQDGQALGRLPIFDFADKTKLRREEGGFFEPPQGVAPQPVQTPVVLQGALEGSNVNPIYEMANLISVSRAYQASQRIVTAHDDIFNQAVRTLGSPQP